MNIVYIGQDSNVYSTTIGSQGPHRLARSIDNSVVIDIECGPHVDSRVKSTMTSRL